MGYRPTRLQRFSARITIARAAVGAAGIIVAFASLFPAPVATAADVEAAAEQGTAPAEAVADAARPGWKAGVARAVITPSTPVWLAGYGSKRVPDGTLHDLWMKALALEDPSGRRAVLVTSDFQGVPRSMSDPVFERVRDRFGLGRAELMITFSHNHCGPRLGDDLLDYYPVDSDQEAIVADYTARMIDRMVDLVGAALADLEPAELAVARGRATFAVNRRNNPEADVPKLRAAGTPLAGPVDHDVPVLRVTRPDGTERAILFGYACHPTTLSFMTWNGDYPGFAQLEIEARHPGATALFVNTCGGDQNPLPRRTVELCRQYGHELAVGVEEALAGRLEPVAPELRTAYRLIDLPYLAVITRPELLEIIAAGRAGGGNAIQTRWAERMLAKLATGETFPAAAPYPLHAWRLGTDTLMLGMGAETVVDYALRFKREFGRGTWVCGYADDMLAYIPSRRVWEEGGYEGGARLYEYGRPALRWAGDIEDRIATVMHEMVAEVRAP
jgi:neutral ceramidase